ncbi:MAG: T9SS type A sorting domain-containing protein [Patescibacteria group bacterium]
MKVILVFAASVLMGTLAPAQTPTIVWQQNFTFGGRYDVPIGITPSTTGFYVNGWSESTTDIRSALTTFSADGIQGWVILDSPDTWSFSGQLAALSADNAVIWYAGRTIGYNPAWIIKTSAAGGEIWRIPVDRLMYLGNYTDTSFVAVLSGSNPIAFIYNRNGVVTRQFPLGGVANGIVTIRTLGSSLWIGSTFPGGVVSSQSYAVAKYDLTTGQREWRREFVDATLGYFDLDRSNGDVAVGGTKLVNEPGGLLKYFLARVDAGSGLVWQREWFGRTTYQANYANWCNSVSIAGSGASKQFVLLGSVERSDTGSTPNDNAYATGRWASNGDSIWAIERTGGSLTRFTGSLGRPNRELYLTQHTYSSQGNVGAFWKLIVPTLSVKELPGLPESFRLDQNYPNPFNPSTVIRFEVLSSKFVMLKVYNSIGQEVATLVNEKLNAGKYEATWDARGIPSGTYFYRLMSDEFVQTKKMVLLK